MRRAVSSAALLFVAASVLQIGPTTPLSFAESSPAKPPAPVVLGDSLGGFHGITYENDSGRVLVNRGASLQEIEPTGYVRAVDSLGCSGSVLAGSPSMWDSWQLCAGPEPLPTGGEPAPLNVVRVPEDSTPVAITANSTEVWYSFSTNTGPTLGFAARNEATRQLGTVPWTASQAPLLASDDSHLVAAAGDLISVFPLTAGGLGDPVSRTLPPGTDVNQLRLTANGAEVLLTGEPGAGIVRLSSANLTDLGTYPLPADPVALAVAPDGTVAAGAGGSVAVYTPGATAPRQTEVFDPGQVQPDGLAWGQEQARLYVVTGTAQNTGLRLNVRYNASTPPTTITTDPIPGSIIAGQTLTLHGHVSPAPLGSYWGSSLHVSEDPTDPSEPGGTDPGGMLLTPGSGGAFTVAIRKWSPGVHHYRISFDGSTVQQAALLPLELTVVPIPTTLLVNAPTAVEFCKDTSITGHVAGAPFADNQTPVQVTETGPDHPTGLTTGIGWLNSDPNAGYFSYRPAEQADGTVRLSFSFVGDATHAPSGPLTITVPVRHCPTTLTLTSWTTPTRGKTFTLTGGLDPESFPDDVQLVRIDTAHPSGIVVATAAPTPDYWSPRPQHASAFSLADTPQLPGPIRYFVRYPGNDEYSSAQSQVLSFAGDRDPTTLTLTANSPRYGYGAHGTVTAHLGAHLAGGTVSLWAQPSGGANVLVKKAAVDSTGNLTVPYTFTRNTVFRASYSGDLRYAAISAAPRSVTTTARLTTSLRGWYTHSGSWRIYHRTAKKRLAVALAAPQPGKCVRVTVQQYVSSHWKTFRDTACVRLASNSTLTWTLPFATPVGAKYRISVASYAGPNPAARSAWLYFAVRR